MMPTTVRPGDRAPCLLKLPRGQYLACGCGQSPDWPLCVPQTCTQAGKSRPFEVSRDGGRVWLCACGSSRTLPHCDGSHNKLGTRL